MTNVYFTLSMPFILTSSIILDLSIETTKVYCIKNLLLTVEKFEIKKMETKSDIFSTVKDYIIILQKRLF